jgi:monoamine oxidase
MPSNPGLFPEDGMGTLLKAFARPLKTFISLEKEVLSVQPKGRTAKVEYKDTITGAKFEAYAKTVVLTVSIGVLQSWIKEKKVVLPQDKVNIINTIRMGKLNKNIFSMDEKFFTDNSIRSFTHINIRSNHLAKDANFLAVEMYGHYYLINFVGGKKSLEYEKRGTAYARKDGLRILASAFGDDVYDFCLDSYLSKWNHNEYFLGAYSSATDFNARIELSKPLDKHIYRAGEEVRYNTDEPSYHTHISGALNSGFMAANQVIRELER